MNHCALVATYFDSPPAWLDFWLLAASRQCHVDFIIFSNCIAQPDFPNVRVIEISFAEFITQAGERIGIAIPAKNYRKVYDLRPTFAESLAPWLDGYELWGYCDMDCIIGNLDLFATGTGIRYDAYLVNARHPMGFLTVFRNDPRINSAWRKGRNAKNYLQSEHSAPLDEVWFGQVLDADPLIMQSKRDLFIWPPTLHTADHVGFEDGHLSAGATEYICCHFGGPGGWRDKMTQFNFNPNSHSFSIDARGMRSL